MHPYARVGVGEISIIDLHTGIVVPESDVGHGHFDYGDESITLTQTAFVELFYISERDVKAAPISTIQESHYDILPGSVLCWRGRTITVIGSKENVLDFDALF
jgi:hypothetical protein